LYTNYQATDKGGFEVMIAADGAIETLIQIEFPGIQIIKLIGYNIKYSHTKKGMCRAC
jgi:hypothetical protein